MIEGARKAVWNALHSASSALGSGIATYRQPERLETIRAIRKLKLVGVFRGKSARLIRQADAVRPQHLFDTFEGLPEPAETNVEIHAGPFDKNEFPCSLEQVRNNLKFCANLHFHSRLFSASGKAVENEKSYFVYSDVDLCASTRSVLEFFYLRLLPGGMILTHDFATAMIHTRLLRNSLKIYLRH